MGAFANDVSRAEALLRVADALLQALGSSELILVLPVPTQNNADASSALSASLGLASPAVEQ